MSSGASYGMDFSSSGTGTLYGASGASNDPNSAMPRTGRRAMAQGTHGRSSLATKLRDERTINRKRLATMRKTIRGLRSDAKESLDTAIAAIKAAAEKQDRIEDAEKEQEAAEEAADKEEEEEEGAADKEEEASASGPKFTSSMMGGYRRSKKSRRSRKTRRSRSRKTRR